MGKRYVVGFLMDHERAHVALVRKTHPEWQAGRLNGVGGKIEEGETPAQAMSREFEEEAGLASDPTFWEEIATIDWPDDALRVGDAEPTSVFFFRGVLAEGYRVQNVVKTKTEEAIEVWAIHVLGMPGVDVIPNLRWLLPLAAYTADEYEPFTLHATVAEVIE